MFCADENQCERHVVLNRTEENRIIDARKGNEFFFFILKKFTRTSSAIHTHIYTNIASPHIYTLTGFFGVAYPTNTFIHRLNISGKTSRQCLIQIRIGFYIYIYMVNAEEMVTEKNANIFHNFMRVA